MLGKYKPLCRGKLTFLNMLCLCGGLMAVQVRAEGALQWQAGLGQTVAHESNVFRQPNDLSPKSDVIATTLANLGVNAPTGIHYFSVQAQLQHQQYNRLTSLNHNAWTINGQLQSQLPERTVVILSVRSQEALAAYNPGNAPAITDRNLERISQWQGVFRVGDPAPWQGEFSALHETVEYTSNLYSPYNLEQDSLGLGIAYRPHSGWKSAVGIRQLWGKRPQAYGNADALEPDRFIQRLLELQQHWSPHDGLAVQAHFSGGEIRHQTVAASDISQNAGHLQSVRLDLQWRPAGRLQLMAGARADRGSDTLIVEAPSSLPFALSTLNARRSEQVYLQARWDVSALWRLDASVNLQKRDIANRLATSGDGEFDNWRELNASQDRTLRWRLGLQWQWSRSGYVGCELNRSRRQVLMANYLSTGSGSLSTPYSADAVACTLRLQWPQS